MTSAPAAPGGPGAPGVPGAPGSPDGPAGAGGARGAPARPPAASAAALAPVFVRLKLALLKNGLRQSTARRAVFAGTGALALLLAAGQLLGMVALRGHANAGEVAVCLVALLALGWAFVPLFFAAGDETLDPTRLTMLPLRPRPLIVSLLLASLVGIGPLFTVTLAAGAVTSVAHGAAGALAACAGAVLVVLLCVCLARAVATANVRLLTSRKGRDLALLSGLVVAVGVQGVNIGVQKLAGSGDGLEGLEPAAEVLRWVPPASAVDAVRAASDGAHGRAATGLALTAAAVVALLWWWWWRSLTRLMTAPDASTLRPPDEERARQEPAALLRLLPAGRTGTAMQRTLRYAWRDPKTKAAWATSLGIGLLLPVVMGVQGDASVYSACWAAGMLGLLMYNQFGQDSSAFWMVASTISTPREAYEELRARALALLVVAVPYVTVVVAGSAAALGQWAELPQALGIALAVLGALMGTGALSSVLFPYAVPQDSGFKNVAPGQAGVAWTSIVGGFVVGVPLCAPVPVLAVALHAAGAEGALWVTLPLGVAYGAALLEAGLRLAAPRLARRLPEVLAAVSR